MFYVIVAYPVIKARERGKDKTIFYSYTITGVVGAVIGIFALFHWFMALKGYTTIEVLSLLESN
jgi:hypothetical protein